LWSYVEADERDLSLSGTKGDGFRVNGFVGESANLRGDLSNQFFVPLGLVILDKLVDDPENPDSYGSCGIEGEDPELCVDAKYRGSGGINGASELELSRWWPCPGLGGKAGRSVE